MARLKRYVDGDRFYVVMDYRYRTQTLQVNARAHRLLTELQYGDESFLPHTLTKSLVLTGDLHTKPGGPDRTDLADNFPRLTPGKCDLSTERQRQLHEFLQRRVGALTREQFDQLDAVVCEETPLDGLDWLEEPQASNRVEALSDIADEYF